MDAYRPLQAVAYERLRDMIQEGALTFDKIYSETRLAAQFSISRTPMRDALIRLQNERYIDILPNRGFRLHQPTREDIIEAYHMRAALESHCAALIARNPKDAQSAITAMEDAAGQQEALCANPDMDLKDFWKMDVQFHDALVSFPHVPAFRQQFDSYMHFFAACSMENYRSRGRDESTIQEHRFLIQALKSGNETAAREAVQRHMDETLNITLLNMKEEKQP